MWSVAFQIKEMTFQGMCTMAFSDLRKDFAWSVDDCFSDRCEGLQLIKCE